jgi:putative ABC transport system ATP-binding protein
MQILTPEIPNATAKPPNPEEGRDPLFQAHGLTKVYPSGDVEVRALNGVDLDLFEGELVVLLGASGSGKSTLLNILGGLDVPTEGTLTYRGEDLTSADEKALTQYRRDTVGFVFQFYNLIPSLTASENRDHFPSQLSGGEQQRVAIARAIAKRPEVLLCDEPTGALDVKTGITVLEAIENVNREFGTLAVIITHNAVIADMADRVINLSSGRITNIRRNPQRQPVRTLVW